MARMSAAALALAATVTIAATAAQAAPDDMSLGRADAKVTVVEYASTTCPHCARWDKDVFPEFRRKYVDTGKVHFVLRELPTRPAELAEAGFLLARCTPQYFETLDALWSGLERLIASGDGKVWLLDAGKQAGLDEAKVNACIEDKAAIEAFGKRLDFNVKALPVKGTPTIFVNGEKVGQGEIPLATVELAVDKALAGARAQPPLTRRRP